MIKKLIILLILSINFMTVNYNYAETPQKLTDKPEWWDQLTDEQKFEYFKEAYNTGVDLLSLLNDKGDRIGILLDDLTKSNNLLKTRWYPKYGFDLLFLAGLDKTLSPDVYANITFKKFFWDGRISLNIGLGIKLYSDLGGGIIVGAGFNF